MNIQQVLKYAFSKRVSHVQIKNNLKPNAFLHTEYSTTGSTGITHMFQEALLYSQPVASSNRE
jgi:hypothetical protein